jgi:hypothetical protein
MPPVGFEPMISAGERPQTYALDRAATGTGTGKINKLLKHYTCIYVSKTIYQVLFNSLRKGFTTKDHVREV